MASIVTNHDRLVGLVRKAMDSIGVVLIVEGACLPLADAATVSTTEMIGSGVTDVRKIQSSKSPPERSLIVGMQVRILLQ